MTLVRPTIAMLTYLTALGWAFTARATEPVAANTNQSSTVEPAQPIEAAPVTPTSPLQNMIQQRLSDPAGKTIEKQDRAALLAYFAERAKPMLWTTSSGLSARGIAAIDELQRAADWGLSPASFEVPDAKEAFATVEQQAAAETRLSIAVLKYARFARGGRIDVSQLGRNFDQKPPLLDPKDTLQILAAAPDTAAALRGFHPKHPQFEKLRQALLAARSAPSTPVQEAAPTEPTGKKSKGLRTAKAPSSGDNTQRILVNMERWRWLPEDLGTFHVWDNIPEYRMRVMKEGKVAHTETIIVGKPSTPTPLFSADMKYVIFHPTWGVPDGIKMNEIAPVLRRSSSSSFWGGDSDPAILRRHNLTVSYNGRPVNPSSVNWETADIRSFQFTQPPSNSNVLGVVKFRFPNKHDVYMHDTPERSLFSRAEKAFSHGCMRVQNPRRLAEVLLAEDKGWSSAQVGNAIAHNATQEVTLNKQIPVHVTYFTALVDDDGQLKTFSDIYGHDSRISAALDGKPIRSISPPTDASSKSSREVRRSPGKGYQTANQGGIAGLFAGLFGN